MSQQSPDSLRRASWQQRQLIKELQLTIQALQRQAILRELSIKERDSKLQNYAKQIHQLRQEREMVTLELQNLKSVFRDFGQKGISNSFSVVSPKLQGKGTLKQSKLDRPILNNSAKQEYVVQPIKLKKEPMRQNKIHNSTSQGDESNVIEKSVGATLAEDFFIIGPDSNDIGIYQEKYPQSQTMQAKPIMLFQWDKTNKSRDMKPQILLRAFPGKISARKLKPKKDDGDIREVVEWIPNYNISEGYFVLNLLGAIGHNDNSNKILTECNANKQMHILCLKMPDIVSFKGRRTGEADIWIVEKIYAISSYYPFFEAHIRLLVELVRALVFQKMNQLKEGGQRFQCLGLEFNIRAFGEQSLLTDMLRSYMNKKPLPNQVYSLSPNRAGTIPGSDKMKLAQANFSSGLVFSNIAYDQFLLILTALMCEKTVILVSKSPTISTFCALGILGLIFPFKYSHTIILNCDQNKVENIIFQSPFPIVASITTKEISKLVSQAVETNIRNDQTQFVLFDLDSNSILMDKHLKNELEKMILTPPEELRQEYLKHNPCRAKSLFLPKQMKIVKGQPGKKSRTKLQEKQELKRLIEQEFLEQIQQNKSKNIDWSPNPGLARRFNSLICQFRYGGQSSKLKKGEDAKELVNSIKQSLLKTNPQHKQFLVNFLETQIFAQYLDSKLY